ncbi:hypothetical protein NW762_013403 [Fusarium torreyae]|uniref:Uncharacterized protein n=1 Tax=Fusarium torreyae TaxID=1237075 RepID=A0A9W8V7S8_9HYPO|nr:hypothetical protein NW762_013403 [Fusarium torreyae]
MAALFSIEDIFKTLKEKSPETTMTFEKAIDFNNILLNIDKADLHIPPITLCCGCLCNSYGYSCACTGNGCYVGMEAKIWIEDGDARYDLKARRIELDDRKPALLPASSDWQTHDITAEKHNFKQVLIAKITPHYRVMACRFNEKMVLWLRDQTVAADIEDSLEDHFIDTNKEVGILVNKLVVQITARILSLPSLKRNNREAIAKGALLGALSRMGQD